MMGGGTDGIRLLRASYSCLILADCHGGCKRELRLSGRADQVDQISDALIAIGVAHGAPYPKARRWIVPVYSIRGILAFLRQIRPIGWKSSELAVEWSRRRGAACGVESIVD